MYTHIVVAPVVEHGVARADERVVGEHGVADGAGEHGVWDYGYRRCCRII